MTAQNENKVVDIYAIFATSRDDSENGKWFVLRPGLRIKLRRLNSKKSRDVRRRLEEPYESMQDVDGGYPDEINEELLIDQVAEAIVVDWEGFGNREGEAMTCTPANIKLLMLDPELSELRDKIILMAMKVDNFRQDSDKATVKN